MKDINLLDIMSLGNEQEFYEFRFYPNTLNEFNNVFSKVTNTSKNTFVNYILLLARLEDPDDKDVNFEPPIKGKSIGFGNRMTLRTTKHILNYKDKLVVETSLTDTQVMNHLLLKGLALYKEKKIILCSL